MVVFQPDNFEVVFQKLLFLTPSNNFVNQIILKTLLTTIHY